MKVMLGLSATQPQGLGALTPQAADVRADSTFELAGLVPGTYELSVTVPAPGWRARSVVLDGRDLLDEPLEIDGRALRGPLVVTFTDRPTLVEGALENLAGRPAPEYTVIAFPADRALWSSPRRVATTRPDTSGRFQLTNLPAGKYVLAVLADDPPDLADRTALLESLSSAALPVTIPEGTPARLNLLVERE